MVANNARAQFGSPTKGKSPKISIRGRVCQTDGCLTVLSIYNASPDCAVHEHRTTKWGRRPATI